MEFGWLIIVLCILSASGLVTWLIRNGYLLDFTVSSVEVESKTRLVQFTPPVVHTKVAESILRIWTSTDAVLQRLVKGTLLTVIPHQDTLTFEFFGGEKMVAKVTIVQSLGNATFFKAWIDPKFITLTQSDYLLAEAGKMHGALRRLVQNPAFKEREAEFKLSGPRALTTLDFDPLYDGSYDKPN